ncbi:hypothetical protein Tco_0959692 [Tanacetum coccineum]
MKGYRSTKYNPLALVLDASVQQYPTQSSKSPQSSQDPYPSDNFQMESGSSSTENLIESLSNSLSLLTLSVSNHIFLKQTIQLRAFVNARKLSHGSRRDCVVQDVRERYNANNLRNTISKKNNAKEIGVGCGITSYNVDDNVDDSPENVFESLWWSMYLEADDVMPFDYEMLTRVPSHRTMSWTNLTIGDR